jgi:HPt (histidine-containing phosphotransfer) domain-containing protein
MIRAIESLTEAPRTAGPVQAPPPSAAILDKNAILERVGGDLDLLRGVIDIFTEDCPRMMANIQTAVAAKSPKALQDAAHSLKGAISNFTSEGPFKAALRLEVLGHSGDLKGVEEDQTALEHEMTTLAVALGGMRSELVSSEKSH